MPYLPYVFPSMPHEILGFNLTGWAWSLMLICTLFQFQAIGTLRFPWKFWMPWAVYMAGYLIYDYSFLGLQLTCQYLLPVMIGLVASSFTYDQNSFQWIFRRFFWLCLVIFVLFVLWQLFRGFTPAAAATPMLLSVMVSIVTALYYIYRKTMFLLAYGILLLVPLISLTRMGIAVFIAVFALHVANRRIKTKILGGLISSVLVILVFNSSAFQEKTFYSGSGKLSDIELNYYESQELDTSGRSFYYKVLKSGLEKFPVFGNGPRADNEVLTIITGMRAGEAHNDYLSVMYNYGFVGLALLLGGFGMTFLRLRSLLKKETQYLRYVLITSTMTLFGAFAMFMYTDNILKYTIYFPNWFFAMAGMAFAEYRNKESDPQ
jgi:O-antigen ligase